MRVYHHVGRRKFSRRDKEKKSSCETQRIFSEEEREYERPRYATPHGGRPNGRGHDERTSNLVVSPGGISTETAEQFDGRIEE